jgi:D-glycero-beta-D-manno-heptose-7-phosphate kinase
LQSLGAAVTVLSVMGKDDDGGQLVKLFDDNNINTKFLVHSEQRITTNKIRIISRNQHMMRLDAELTSDISKADEDRLIYAFENFIAAEMPNVVVLEDYNKGVLTANVIAKIIELCRHHKIVTTVDPKRKNFFAYKGVDIFKPNLKEVKEGLNLLSDEVSLAALKDIHVQLQDKWKHQISFITLSEKGVFYNDDKTAAVIPTHIRNVADVSGAGDTVIAVASLVYATTKNVVLMADMANIAGGLVCEEVGTVAIDKEKLLEECKKLLR